MVCVTQIWCAAGVNLSGGKTRDGGSVVGASVFYSNTSTDETNEGGDKDDIEKLDQELKVGLSRTGCDEWFSKQQNKTKI